MEFLRRLKRERDSVERKCLKDDSFDFTCMSKKLMLKPGSDTLYVLYMYTIWSEGFPLVFK